MFQEFTNLLPLVQVQRLAAPASPPAAAAEMEAACRGHYVRNLNKRHGSETRSKAIMPDLKK
jgi:hypothetical protein